jgi:hypothetical protein
VVVVVAAAAAVFVWLSISDCRLMEECRRRQYTSAPAYYTALNENVQTPQKRGSYVI